MDKNHSITSQLFVTAVVTCIVIIILVWLHTMIANYGEKDKQQIEKNSIILKSITLACILVLLVTYFFILLLFLKI